jgi:hypothetical protein
MIFLFITILVSDMCASYVSRKLLKWWRFKWKSLFLLQNLKKIIILN